MTLSESRVVEGFAKRLDCMILRGDDYVDGGQGVRLDVVRPVAFEGLEFRLPKLWRFSFRSASSRTVI